MRAIQLTLGDYLAANGLTPALLLEATREQVTARALDSLTGGHTQRLDLRHLGGCHYGAGRAYRQAS